MNDIKNIFIEYNFINFVKFNFNIEYDIIYPDIDIIHINSILFNNLKDNYYFFINNFFNGKKIFLTIHDYQWIFPEDPNIIKENFLLNITNNHNNFIMLLNICDKIIFPSYNIYNNYNKIVDLSSYSKKINIVNHFDRIINHNFLVIPNINKKINIAFIGYFINYKGRDWCLWFQVKYCTA